MKIKLLYKIALFSMLVFFLSPVYAQRQSGLLLAYVAPDSATATARATANMNVAAIVPLQSNLQNYVEKYLDENEEVLQQIKKSKSALLNTIREILLKRGVPAGLMYLAIVESELKSTATSGAGAAGIWQLMPSTARSLGLKVNGKNDQRRHDYKSTVVAADYLKSLYKQYDDWLLVVAAYNCGAGNVNKAIKLSGSRDFWKLQRFLPAETRGHVKHFIATHFYYEENGSMVTLTKKERTRHLESLNETMVKPDEQKPAAAPATLSLPLNKAVMLPQEVELISEL